MSEETLIQKFGEKNTLTGISLGSILTVSGIALILMDLIKLKIGYLAPIGWMTTLIGIPILAIFIIIYIKFKKSEDKSTNTIETI